MVIIGAHVDGIFTNGHGAVRADSSFLLSFSLLATTNQAAASRAGHIFRVSQHQDFAAATFPVTTVTLHRIAFVGGCYTNIRIGTFTVAGNIADTAVRETKLAALALVGAGTGFIQTHVTLFKLLAGLSLAGALRIILAGVGFQYTFAFTAAKTSWAARERILRITELIFTFTPD